MKKHKDKIKDDLVIVGYFIIAMILIGITVFLLAGPDKIHWLLHEEADIFEKIQWFMSQASSNVGWVGTAFSFFAWTVARRLRKQLNKSADMDFDFLGNNNSLALFVTTGPGSAVQVDDYLKKYITENQNDPNQEQRVREYRSIRENTLKRLSPKEKDAVNPESGLSRESLESYVCSARGTHDIKAWIVRDHDDKGKIIEVSCQNIANDEESIRYFMKDFTDTIDKLQEYYALNGVGNIHLFESGMMIPAMSLANLYSNRFEIYTYHWGNGTYLLADQLTKGAK